MRKPGSKNKIQRRRRFNRVLGVRLTENMMAALEAKIAETGNTPPEEARIALEKHLVA